VTVARRLADLIGSAGDCIVHGNGEEVALVGRLRKTQRFGFVVTPRYPAYPARLRDGLWRRRALSRFFTALTGTRYAMLGSALRRADLWCPTSQYSAAETGRVHGLDATRMRIVYNGVSDEFLGAAPRSESRESGPVRAVFFGRLARDKGVYTILEALRAAETPPDELLLIGRGDEASGLKARAKELGLERRVRFVPWVEASELARLVGQAHFAVLPSFHESFGNSVAEGMALGLPVISTRAGSIPEIIEDGRTGVLVDAGYATALAAAMSRLVRDPEHAAALGRAARASVLDRFTWDAAAAAFEGHYRTLLPSGLAA